MERLKYITSHSTESSKYPPATSTTQLAKFIARLNLLEKGKDFQACSLTEGYMELISSHVTWVKDLSQTNTIFSPISVCLGLGTIASIINSSLARYYQVIHRHFLQ